jgi:hypothetical protein
MEKATMEFSDLYCIYKGFMLGQFLHQSERLYTEMKYDALSRRIREFLQELYIVYKLPSKHADFKKFDSQLGNLADSLYQVSQKLVRSFFLGYFSTEYFMHRAFGIVTDINMVNDFFKLSGEFGVEKDIVEKIALNIPHNAITKDISADDLLSVSLAYLKKLLVPVSHDPHAAFVAMPFEDPFLERYTNVYYPALKKSGYCAIRAWGGLSSETYSTMMLLFIGKCEMLLADLSTMNLNVLYEVGVAHGQNKNAILLSEKRNIEFPSNLGEFRVMLYDTTADNWEKEAIFQIKGRILAIQAAVTEKIQKYNSEKATLNSDG